MPTVAGHSMAHTQLRALGTAGVLDRFGLCPEIIGELVIRGSPSTRHQRVVTRLVVDLGVYTDAHGGAVLTGPFGVKLDPARHVAASPRSEETADPSGAAPVTVRGTDADGERRRPWLTPPAPAPAGPGVDEHAWGRATCHTPRVQ